MEQTARLNSFKETLDKLKVSLITSHNNTGLLRCLEDIFSFQAEVSQHVVSQQPGARVPSDFATFPAASFLKV